MIRSNSNEIDKSSKSYLSSRLKFNLLGAILFEYLSKLNDFNRLESTGRKLHLDEEQLKKLNSIFSNLPYNILKQEYDKHSYEYYLSTHISQESKTKEGGSKKKHSTTKKSLKSRSKASSIGHHHSSSIKSHPHRKSSINSVASSHYSTSTTTSHKHHPINVSIDNQITIHVCDEVKRLKQDFMCPRELLVTEMRYFSSSLVNKISSVTTSTNGTASTTNTPGAGAVRRKASLDDIDISVHCDINIFDWLMRYVKRWHPQLIEKNITSPADKPFSEATNKVVYSSTDGSVKCVEPLLDVNNVISILLSSDFLIMNELIEKCVLFIANNLEAIIQVPCLFNSISERLLGKIAACVPVARLHDLADKKDKVRSRLFQRKIEFMFDTEKLKHLFNETTTTTTKNSFSNDEETFSSFILNEWTKNPNDFNNAYLNYLYECENDATTLFKCKLCNRHMTRRQSAHLKCTQTLLNRNGELIYMHCSDEARFDLIGFLRLVKEHMKSWSSVYWFVWSLIKSFRCKKCLKWFRLVDMNRCRLNEFTLCAIHDSVTDVNNSSSSSSAACTCMFAEHLVDTDSLNDIYAKSQSVINSFPDPESSSSQIRLAKFVQFQLDLFDKVKDLVLSSSTQNDKSPCDLIETVETKSVSTAVVNTNDKGSSKPVYLSSFVDSITGKHLSLVNKNMLNLIKQSYNTSNESQQQQQQIDFKSFISITNQIDPNNIANNTLSGFSWLKIDPKMKWEQTRPIRLNQDNQREDDLRRLREISSNLVKLKVGGGGGGDENNKTTVPKQGQKSTLPNNTTSNTNSSVFPGGIYCRIENEWKQRNN